LLALTTDQLSMIREGVQDDFRCFLPVAWPLIEPGKPFKSGWHIDCIAEHLQAVSEGEIRRLLINIPPRHMKSTLVSVMFPAWKWIKDPEHHFLGGSYGQQLSMRDCRRSRQLMTTPEYRQLIKPDKDGNIWEFSGDQNVKSMYVNTRRGQRFATSVGGALTGEGGDTIIIDDPHNVQDVTDNSLEAVKSWWTEALPTRLNDPKTGSFIVIQQRVHEDDLTGVILDSDDSFVTVCLPARFEGTCRIDMGIVSKTTGRKWVDPRIDLDQPLWPEQYDDASLKSLEASMSAMAVAGQLQQRPAPAEGGEFKEVDYCKISELDDSLVSKCCRGWDFAGTDGDGDWTVGALVCLMKSGRLAIADECRGQWSLSKRQKRVKQITLADYRRFGSKYEMRFEQEGGSGGKDSAAITKKSLMYNEDGTSTELMGCKISSYRPTGDKRARAESYITQVQNHNVDILELPWTKPFIREHCVFPNGSHDDRVDATATAVVRLTIKRKGRGTWGKGDTK